MEATPHAKDARGDSLQHSDRGFGGVVYGHDNDYVLVVERAAGFDTQRTLLNHRRHIETTSYM
jgi:hypothetical protein